MQKGRLCFNDTIFTDIKYGFFFIYLFFLPFDKKKIACCESAISHWKVVGIGHFDF